MDTTKPTNNVVNKIARVIKKIFITTEDERPDNFVSTTFFGRATIFHPSKNLSEAMIARKKEIAGVPDGLANIPLVQVEADVHGESYTVSLYGEYLLQVHREILETVFAHGKCMKCDRELLDQGVQYVWGDIYDDIESGSTPRIDIKKASPKEREIVNPNTLVKSPYLPIFSMSLYELATRLGMSPNRKNYESIMSRIRTLHMAQVDIRRKLPEGGYEEFPVSFLDDYRFYCDHSKLRRSTKERNEKGDVVTAANHIFLVPSPQLLQAIRFKGYFKASEQASIANYSKPSVKSFLKYLGTHKRTFVEAKTLDYMIGEYVASIASETSRTFSYDLKKTIIELSGQIEKDFKYQIKMSGGKHRLYNVENTK